jgi:hypothetical protein
MYFDFTILRTRHFIIWLNALFIGSIGHFVYLSCSEVAAGCSSSGSSRSSKSNKKRGSSTEDGRHMACFEAGEIPPVVQVLWPYPEVSAFPSSPTALDPLLSKKRRK